MPELEDMCATLKKTAAALRDAAVPFMLGGGLAAWVRGGPESDHDLDYMVRPEDAERALEALVGAGLRSERPPERWLLKAWDGDVFVDLIFRPASGEVGDEEFERAETVEVLALEMPVMSLEDVLVTKLLAITETHLDFKSVLELARAVREQIDWEAVRERTECSPFARAFFTLVEELEIVPAPSMG
jgi:predicted nucleotidyltransferase